MKLLSAKRSWIIEELYPIEWRFLSQLPALAAGEEFSEDCLRRLKPNPLGPSDPMGARDFELIEDWSEFVQPDLDRLFGEARACVATDLQTASQVKGPGPVETEAEWRARVEVSDDHSEHWYSVLNQARLLMNEAHGLGEFSARYDLGDIEESEEGFEKFLLLAQYEFYTAIQSFLIEQRMNP